jgi:cell division protein ZapA
MESGKVKVNIYGQTYNIRGDAPPEYILELAEYVNGKMEEVSRNVTISNSLQIAILVALNIADEYYQLKKLNVGIEGVIEEKTREIISMLDEGLIGDIFPGVDTVHS